MIDKKKFDKLSNRQKRVEIAKDVLARIKAEKMTANTEEFYHGTFLNKDIINKDGCGVCAKGAIFCSWVGNFNEVNINFMTEGGLDLYNFNNPKTVRKYPEELLSCFSREMLDHMEAAFEQCYCWWHYDESICLEYAGLFDDIDNNTERLAAIMQHIVENNGDFPLAD